MTVLRIAALTAVLAAPLAAQSDWRPIGQLPEPGASPTITAPVDPNLPQYRVQSGDSRFDGVVRLIMNTTAGNFVCSGSLLDRSGRTGILAAAHCFTNGVGVNITNSVTVEFRSAQTGALLSSLTTAGSNISIKSGYTGNVVDQRDVAFIRLSEAVPTGIGGNGYELHSGGSILGQTINLAGYGATGNGTTGAQGNAQTWMRYGQNRFDTSCRQGSGATFCAGVTGSNPSTDRSGYGGVLVGDMDDPTNVFNNNSSISCVRYGICEGAVTSVTPGEVNIGGGDSGSAAFLASTNTILGVASFGTRSTNLPPFGGFGTGFGYACVGAVTGNAVCNENYSFVQSFLVPTVVIPEPSTYALLATGLVAMGMIARRRRSAR
jgi:hypothetical protein